MPEVIGRRREVTAAVEHLGRAVETGRAQLLLVEGLAGIGKSTLLGAVTTELTARGFHAIRVTLTAAETTLSWAGLIHLCSQFDPSAAAMLPSAQRAALASALGTGDANEAEPVLMAMALAGLLSADLAARGPLLLVVDDVHWLDQASASALSFAVRTSSALPIAVVIASRPERRPLDPLRLLDADHFLHLGLEGISLSELQELLAARFGVVHRRPDLIRIHDACAGNVMHAIEVGRMLAAGHSLDEALVPRTLHALIDGELAGLSAAVLDVLEPAALLARPTVALLERVVPDAEAALAAAETAGIISERDGRLVFSHPLLRAGLLERIGGVRRRRLERLLADVVDDPEERVLLRAAAATEPDEQVAAELEAVGNQALAVGATHIAALHFDRSVELTPPGDAARARRLLSAAVSHVRAGDISRAHPRFELAIAAGLTPNEEATAIIGLTSVITEIEGPAEAALQLARAAERLRVDPAARIRVLLWHANVLLFDDLRQALSVGRVVLAEATQLDEPVLRLHAEIVHAIALFFTGHPVDVTALAALVRETPEAAHGPNGLRAAYFTPLLVWSDQTDAAIEREQAEVRSCRSAGNVSAEAATLQSLTDAYFRCGRWDDGQAASERWAELTAIVGSDPAAEGSYTDLAWLLAMRGRFDEARRRADEAVEGTKRSPMWHMQARAYAGVVAAAAGDHASAAEHLSAARDLADEIGFEDLCALQFRDTGVEVLLALGDVDAAAAEAERITELAHRAQRPRGLVQAARSRAMVAAAQGDLEAATVALDEAMNALDGFADPFERGRTLLFGGTVARRAGRRTESRAQLEEARRLFEPLGAVPFVERVDAELQRLGARTGRTDLLTHGELQVAQLVCDGRTNAEVAAALFITPRTVEAHLTRVYRKLGVRSRAELISRRTLLDA